MELKNYLKQLPKPERHKLAESVNTSLGQLQNIAYGCRTCAPALAVSIERVTGGAVSRRDLLPADWPSIWPEMTEQAA